MTTVEVKRNYYGLQVFLNDTLHLNLPLDGPPIIESWVDTHMGRYYIEYTHGEQKVRCEYQDRDTWKAILDQLTGFYPI